MAISALGQLFKSIAPEKKPNEKTISYSQFAMWSTCPLRWKLNYIDRTRFGNPSIHFTFGTSFHEVLQYYLYTMFNKSAKDADCINLPELLHEQMVNNYMIAVAENKDQHFSTAAELGEFYNDGVAILDWLMKRRSTYFPTKGHELIAIEMPIYTQASSINPHVMMNGFLDIVIRDTVNDRIKIIDIKTSTRGWKKEKEDKLKTSQLVLYKSYIAKQYGYDEEKIDIEYLIVKRKLIDGFMYPQKRVQQFTPPSGKPTRNKLQKEIDEFIKAGFNLDGSYKADGEFPALAGGKGCTNCRYCEFADKDDLCPKANRIKNVL